MLYAGRKLNDIKPSEFKVTRVDNNSNQSIIFLKDDKNIYKTY